MRVTRLLKHAPAERSNSAPAASRARAGNKWRSVIGGLQRGRSFARPRGIVCAASHTLVNSFALTHLAIKYPNQCPRWGTRLFQFARTTLPTRAQRAILTQ